MLDVHLLERAGVHVVRDHLAGFSAETGEEVEGGIDYRTGARLDGDPLKVAKPMAGSATQSMKRSVLASVFDGE